MKSEGISNIWAIRHGIIFGIVSLTVLLPVVLGKQGTTAHYLILLLMLLPFFGIPHGALDYPLAKRLLFDRFGNTWALWFVTAYMLCIIAVVAAWMLFPTLSLVVFLALSLYHFGTGDATAICTSPTVVKVTEFVSRGGIVLTFPAAFDSREVQVLFSYLVPESSAVKIIAVLTELTPLVAACFIICTLTSVYEFLRRKKTLDLLRAFELLSLGSLFTLLPALLSFTVYFSFLHSVRHMLKVVSDGTTVSMIQGLLGAFRKSLPVTVATIVLGGVVYFWDGKLALDISKTVQIVFIGIASMTYPHVLVIALAGRSQTFMNAIGTKTGILFAPQPTDSKA